MAYNQHHQLAVSKQISELIESKKQDIKLLVVNNLTKFFKQSKNKNSMVKTNWAIGQKKRHTLGLMVWKPRPKYANHSTTPRKGVEPE
jgi:hypothetical protein